MKKLFVLTSAVLLALSLVSCGGIASAGLSVHVYVQDENGNYLNESQLKTLSCKANTKQARKDNSVHDVTMVWKDNEGLYSLFIEYSLGGFTHSVKRQEKMRDSYLSKMKDFWFEITDKSNTYEPFAMKPLNETGYTVTGRYSGRTVIKYTIKLKKK